MYEAFLDFQQDVAPSRTAGSEKVQEKATGKWPRQLEKYDQELPQRLAEADKLKAEAEEYQKKAGNLVKESHTIHARADRFDLGELGLQLGVVLCSLAILTKSRYFWYSGLACSLLGLLVALSGAFGWFMGEGGHH